MRPPQPRAYPAAQQAHVYDEYDDDEESSDGTSSSSSSGESRHARRARPGVVVHQASGGGDTDSLSSVWSSTDCVSFVWRDDPYYGPSGGVTRHVDREASDRVRFAAHMLAGPFAQYRHKKHKKRRSSGGSAAAGSVRPQGTPVMSGGSGVGLVAGDPVPPHIAQQQQRQQEQLRMQHLRQQQLRQQQQQQQQAMGGYGAGAAPVRAAPAGPTWNGVPIATSNVRRTSAVPPNRIVS